MATPGLSDAAHLFFVDPDDGNDAYSGSDPIGVKWNGTLTSNNNGAALTKAAGDQNFVDGVNVRTGDNGDFVRFDSGGGNDALVRVLSVTSVSVITVADPVAVDTAAAEGSCYIGGPFEHITTVGSTGADDVIPKYTITDDSILGDINIYVRQPTAGAIEPGEIMTFNNNSGSIYYRRIIGCDTDWTIGGWQTDGTLKGPTIDFGNTSDRYLTFSNTTGCRYALENFDVDNAYTSSTSGGAVWVGTSANGVILNSLKIHGNTNGLGLVMPGYGCHAFACDVYDNAKGQMDLTQGKAFGCHIHDANVIFPGLQLRSNAAALYCVIEDLTGLHVSNAAIKLNGSGVLVHNCIVYGCNRGLLDLTGFYGVLVVNSIISSDGASGSVGLDSQFGTMLLGVAYDSKETVVPGKQPIPDEDVLMEIDTVTGSMPDITSDVWNTGWANLLPMDLRAAMYTSLGAYQRQQTTAGGSGAGAPTGGENANIQFGGRVYFSNPYKIEPESFHENNFIPMTDNDEPITAWVQYKDSLYIFTPVRIFKILRGPGTITVLDSVQGYGAVHEKAVASTPLGVAFLGLRGLFLLGANTPIEIGQPIREWLTSADMDDISVHFDSVDNKLWVQNKTTHEAAVGLFKGEGFVWTLLQDRPGVFQFNGVDLTGSTNDMFLYTIDQYGYIYQECRDIDSDSPNTNIRDPGAELYSGVIGTGSTYATKDLTLTSGSFGATNYMKGAVLRVTSGTSKGEVRLITASTGTVATHDGAVLTMSTGATWVIASIPFVVRFPSIRGENPFARKVLFTTSVLGSADSETTMTVETYRGFTKLSSSGSGGTLKVGPESTTTDNERVCTSRVDGKFPEVEISNYESAKPLDIYYVEVTGEELASKRTEEG